MPDPNLPSFMYLAYFSAGAAFLLAMATVLIRLWLSAGRRGSPSRTLTGEELIWTLVPALVLLGLTVAGEIPRGWGKVVAGPAAGEVRVLPK
ncbi:MAG: hypothetical protein A2Z31_05490 [candidate division NC10 bacterium RBG_16_65_8]|nr:MAG: hypothetical protein A2Z31_05490 [candidate division NC10 bacterium RBG_16_65_8]